MSEAAVTGATIQSAAPTPEIDLARLVSWLVKICCDTSLLAYDRRLKSVFISTGDILQGLPTDDKIFINAKPASRSWKTTSIGGRIVRGTDLPLREALRALEEHIKAEFEALCIAEHFSPNDLAITQVDTELKRMGKGVGGYMDRTDPKTITRLQATTFVDFADSSPNLSTNGRVGRVMSAVELLEAGDRLDLFLESVERLMLGDPDRSTDEVREITDDLRSNYARNDKQLAEFIKFLDDDGTGQARIRSAVARDIMDAIRRIALRSPNDIDAQLAAEYIRRVLAVATVDGLEIDLDQHYGAGAGAKFLLSTEVTKANFYAFLPVWCRWDTTLLEAVTNPEVGSSALQRHIGYRFKVNGKAPEEQTTGFEWRLKLLKDALLPEEPPEQYKFLTTPIAQLLVLATVVPRSYQEVELDVANSIGKGVDYLNQIGLRAIRSILENLKQRAQVMMNIARAITKILKQRNAIIDELAQPNVYYLNVSRGILDQERAFNGKFAPLVAPTAGQNQQVVFFAHTEITRDRPLPGALFSLQTQVTLKELLICAVPDTIHEGLAQRKIPEHLIQIIWHPANKLGEDQAHQWRLRPASIVVDYNPNLLGRADAKIELDALRLSLLAVRRTAFTVLTYVALKCICERINAARAKVTHEPITALMLRLQDQGRDADNMGSSHGVYAASQAIEHALGQHLRVRMQGLATVVDPKTQSHKQKTTFNALLSAFPLLLQTPQRPIIKRIGVLTVVSRVVTDHENLTTDEHKDFLLVGRTYQALADENLPGYKLVAGANLLAVEPGRDTFNNSLNILDAIKRLYNSGCKHIIYMGQRSGGRQLGRGAIRHRHYEKPEFLARIQNDFPGLQLYPMVHNVFPATRLRKRNGIQDAFEILDYHSHLKMWHIDGGKLDVRDLVPIYSLATLNVVGGDNDERPQSGFATYFLLTDPAPERLEQETSKRLDLIKQDSALRHDLIAVLRGIHYFESEAMVKGKGQGQPKYNQPVLHPYFALQPVNIAGAGEIVIHPKVVLSLAAVLARVTEILKAPTTSPNS